MQATQDGFLTDDDTERLERVVLSLQLNAPTLHARLDHTGGGVFCIYTRIGSDERYLYWGTADGVWGAEAHEPDGEVAAGGHVATDLPADADVNEIVQTIKEATRRADRT
jgi:hypothetical protein